jgi:uncharacterized OB-fold protein
MSAVEPVKSIVTPTRLEYEYTAVGAQAYFLDEISRGHIVGQRCPKCRKVYVPPRGACPRCGVATSERLEISDKGTVTTFCVVRVPSENIHLKLPFVAAHILLDGADIPFFNLVGDCEHGDVRMGMRVQAVWAPREEWGPTFKNIRHFRPTGEPDVPFEKFKEHL